MIQHPLPPFAHGRALRQALRLLQAHKGLYGLSLLLVLLYLVGIASSYLYLEHLVETPTPETSPRLLLYISPVLGLVLCYLVIVLQTRALQITAPQSANEGTPPSAYRIALSRLLPQILLGLILSLVCSLGIMLFIVPGLYIALRLSFVNQVYIERGKLWPAVKEAWRLTEGHFYSILLLWVIVLGLTFLGSLPLGLGLILVLPLQLIYQTLFYRYLQGIPSQEADEAIS